MAASCYCGGSSTAPRHAFTATHLKAVQARGRAVEVSGPARRGMPTVLRDPYGSNRDWEEEQRSWVRARHEEAGEAIRDLILYGPLPEPPVKSTMAGVDYITLRDAAKRLGVQPVTLRMAIRRGKMNGRKLGRDWLVEESEVAWYELRSRGRVGYPKGRPRKTA